MVDNIKTNPVLAIIAASAIVLSIVLGIRQLTVEDTKDYTQMKIDVAVMKVEISNLSCKVDKLIADVDSLKRMIRDDRSGISNPNQVAERDWSGRNIYCADRSNLHLGK